MGEVSATGVINEGENYERDFLERDGRYNGRTP
jgi:hypothetical protein